MKPIYALLVAASALAFASGAHAADLIINEPPVADTLPAEGYDWSGPYIGINAGVAQGIFKHPFAIGYEDYCDYDCPETLDASSNLLDGSGDVTAGGFIYGVTAGYNVQMDGIVLGVEADIQGSTVDGRVSLDLNDDIGILGGDTFHIDAGTSLDWWGTVRARLGATFDRTLLYVTAGPAWGRTTSSLSASLGGTSLLDLSEENDRMGWTAGIGLEQAIADNITFKTEYLYTDLGSANLFDGPIIGPINATVDSNVTFHTVRAGLNFHF